MTQKQKKTKRRRRRKLTPVMKLICLIAIGVSVYLLYLVGNEALTTIRLQQELREAEELLEEVKDENKYLVDKKAKLQDPDYVENYARSNYMLSKSGEQIFYLPENENK